MDLLLIILASVILIPIAILTEGPVRMVLGFIFILFSPGYTLLKALFPKRDDLATVQRLSLSIGLSIAIMPPLGFILHFTPWGINLISLLVSVTIIIALAIGVARFRRRELFPTRWHFDLKGVFLSIVHLWKKQNLWERILIGLLALAILGAFGTLGYLLEKPEIKVRGSEFYILGPGGKAENYPDVIALGEEAEVTLGIVNYDSKAATYYIEITIDEEKVKEIEPVTLESNQAWEDKVHFAAIKTGERQEVVFLLYKVTREEAEQTLHFWVDVIEGF